MQEPYLIRTWGQSHLSMAVVNCTEHSAVKKRKNKYIHIKITKTYSYSYFYISISHCLGYNFMSN